MRFEGAHCIFPFHLHPVEVTEIVPLLPGKGVVIKPEQCENRASHRSCIVQLLLDSSAEQKQDSNFETVKEEEDTASGIPKG